MDRIINCTYYILSVRYLVLDRLFSSSKLREVQSWPISYEDYKSTIFFPQFTLTYATSSLEQSNLGEVLKCV
jgi:hypothetical protein